MGASSEGEVN